MAWFRTKIGFSPGPLYRQLHYRLRTDDSQGLNVDGGWAAALDTGATIDAEKAFRLRIEVEEFNNVAEGGSGVQFYLQYRKNGGTWLPVNDNGGYPVAIATPAVTALASAQYVDGDATTNILAGSSLTFQAGGGNEDGVNAPMAGFQNEHTELEWCLLIRRHYDGARNDDGDTFEFRLVEDSETHTQRVLSTYSVTPTVTLNIPVGLIGGTLVESPGRVGPFKDGNGNLYYIHERAETNNVWLISKSTDGGDTWVDVDTANRPTKNDLEGVDAVLENDRLYILHQATYAVFHHVFKVSTAGTGPDTWELKDEELEPNSNPAITPSNQFAAISRRSDGDLVGFFLFNNGTNSQVYYRIKPSGGSWGSRIQLDSEAVNFSGVACVRGASDKTHIVYADDAGNVYHRSLDSADTLSARESLTTTAITTQSVFQPLAAPVYWDEAGTEKVLVSYVKSDGLIYSRIITNDGTPGSESAAASDNTVYRNGGSSHGVCYQAANDGADVYIIYGDNTTQDIFRDKNPDEAGWGTDAEQLDAVTCDNITAQVFTHSAGNGGSKVLGFVYENGTDGYTGQLWYNEHVIAAAALNVAVSSVSLRQLAAVGAAVALQFAPLAPESISGARSGEPQVGYTLNVESVAPPITLTGEGQALLNLAPEGVRDTARTGEPSLTLALAPEGVTSGAATGEPAVARTITAESVGNTARTGEPSLTQRLDPESVGDAARTGAPAATFAALPVEGVSDGARAGEPTITLVLAINPESVADRARSGEPAATFAALGVEGVRDSATTGDPQAGYTLGPESIGDAARTGRPSATPRAAPEGVADAARTGEPGATYATIAPASAGEDAHTGEPVVSFAQVALVESIQDGAHVGEPAATHAPLLVEGVRDTAHTGEPLVGAVLSPPSAGDKARTGEPASTYAALAIESTQDGAHTGEPAVSTGAGQAIAVESIGDGARTGEPSIPLAIAPEGVRDAAHTSEPSLAHAAVTPVGGADRGRIGSPSFTLTLAVESVRDAARTGEPTAGLPQTATVSTAGDDSHVGSIGLNQAQTTEVSSAQRGPRVGTPHVDMATDPARTAFVESDSRGVIALHEDREAEVPAEIRTIVLPS